MRRLGVSALIAVGSVLASGCSGGTGIGTGGSTITAIVFTNGSGQVNDFFVAPGGTAPIRITATGVSGSTGADVVPGQTFTWTARFVNPATDPASISTYVTGVAPSTYKTCPAPPATQPAVPILVPAATSSVTEGYAGYAALAAGTPVATVFEGAVPATTPPYCLVLTATHPGDGVVGTVTVVVSQSP